MRRRVGLALAGLAALLAGCHASRPATVHLYDPVAVPAVPDRTAAVTGPLRDGQYWAATVTASGGRLVFTLTQAFFGPTCATVLGAGQCPDSVGTLDTPTATIGAAPDDLISVSVVDAQQKNYAITGAELLTLVSGGPPAATAPNGFAFVGDPFLVTVTGAKVVQAQQIWVS